MKLYNIWHFFCILLLLGIGLRCGDGNFGSLGTGGLGINRHKNDIEEKEAYTKLALALRAYVGQCRFSSGDATLVVSSLYVDCGDGDYCSKENVELCAGLIASVTCPAEGASTLSLSARCMLNSQKDTIWFLEKH